MLGKLLLASILTGIISGFFMTFYEMLITFFTYLFFFGNPLLTIPSLPVWYLYALPTIAIFFVNYLVSKDNYIREYALNEIAESVMQNKMVLTIKTLFLKIIASSLSISTGFMVGTEGPSAGVGAMIAYQIHKLFNLPAMLVKMMISVGASSGVAAIFVSPLTGIAFSIETIAYQFLKQYVGYLILSSVIAFSISTYFLDTIFAYHFFGRKLDYTFMLPIMLFIPFITAFIYFYLFFKKRLLHLIDLRIFKNFHPYRNYIFAVIGGGVVGTILLLEPLAAFSGKEVVIYLLNEENHIPFVVIFSIILLRIIGTTVSIYSNAVGGVFLPLMSIGALIGFAFGELLLQFYPLELESFYFAAVGASVFMGVIMKLPLTALVLAMETTFDYNVVIATGIGVVLVAYFSNFHFKIRKKNVNRAK